jgi:hypothetical protein
MPQELVITSRARPEARLVLRADSAGEMDVEVVVRGMTAHTRVDARQSASSGWEHPEPGLVLDTTQRGLVELLEYLASHTTGWPDEERWESRDGRLLLGFSSLGDQDVLMSIVVKQYVPDGWVAYAKLHLTIGALSEIRSGARQLLAQEKG